jgi:hypothetical protein
MNTLFVVSTICTISILLNILSFWYIKAILKKLLYVSDNIGDLQERLGNYAEHIESMYQMETFYGDETLQNLISHSKEIVDMIRDYEDIYSLTQEEVKGEILNDETTDATEDAS